MAVPEFKIFSEECKLVKDNYENGEELYGDAWLDNHVFTGNTAKEAVLRLCKHYSMDIKNAIVFDDEIIINALTDYQQSPLTETEIEQWKKNEFTAYSFSVRFRIQKVEDVLHDDLIYLTGIESYD